MLYICILCKFVLFFYISNTIVFIFREQLAEKAQEELNNLVWRNMEIYFSFVEEILVKEQDKGDTIILVRALDRFYRRLQPLNALFPSVNFVMLVSVQITTN